MGKWTDYSNITDAYADFAAVDSTAKLMLAVGNNQYVFTKSQLQTWIAALAAAGYQPLDSDLTAIAALTTTSFGRAFLALADEAAFKAAVNLEIGVDVQAYDVDTAKLDVTQTWIQAARQTFLNMKIEGSGSNSASVLCEKLDGSSFVFGAGTGNNSFSFDENFPTHFKTTSRANILNKNLSVGTYYFFFGTGANLGKVSVGNSGSQPTKTLHVRGDSEITGLLTLLTGLNLVTKTAATLPADNTSGNVFPVSDGGATETAGDYALVIWNGTYWQRTLDGRQLISGTWT